MSSRILSCSFALFFCVCLVPFLNSCTPTVAPEVNTNFLGTKPDTLAISKTQDTIYSQMALNCGCAFDFSITGAGDTSKIKFIVPKSATKNSYSVGATAIAGLTSGSYSSWIGFQSKNDDPTGPKYFYDTLHATIVVP